MDGMTLGEITEVLSAMELGDVITFPDGSIAHRLADGWEVTLPSPADAEEDNGLQEERPARPHRP